MRDAFTPYEIGLTRLLETLGKNHPRYVEALTLQARLLENLAQTRRYGDTETHRAGRAQMVEALNRLALEETRGSFNELCGFTLSTKRLTVLLDRLLTRTGLPPDVPLHERLANLLMISLGQIREDSVAVMSQLLALLILSVFFARWLAQVERTSSVKPWQNYGIIWLGLTILPLIAGTLPQQKERDLYKRFRLTMRQRLALRLDKALGVYISAYLGEIAAIVAWLGLYYLGLWDTMLPAIKAVFWFIMEWTTFVLSFVGVVIATKYWENLLDSGRRADLQKQHFLLGLGFPLVVYPTIMFFGLATLPLWRQWQFGCLTTASAFLFLAWMLSRKPRRQSP